MKNLRKLRESKGISQQKLGDQLGTTQQAIYKYEKQQVEPDIYMLQKMCDFFDVSIDYLVGYSDFPHKIEQVKEFDLNKQEQQVIQGFRELPIPTRKIIKDLIVNISENKN